MKNIIHTSAITSVSIESEVTSSRWQFYRHRQPETMLVLMKKHLSCKRIFHTRVEHFSPFYSIFGVWDTKISTIPAEKSDRIFSRKRMRDVLMVLLLQSFVVCAKWPRQRGYWSLGRVENICQVDNVRNTRTTKPAISDGYTPRHTHIFFSSLVFVSLPVVWSEAVR